MVFAADGLNDGLELPTHVSMNVTGGRKYIRMKMGLRVPDWHEHLRRKDHLGASLSHSLFGRAHTRGSESNAKQEEFLLERPPIPQLNPTGNGLSKIAWVVTRRVQCT